MIGIVVLDALQALLFDNSPIIKIRENNVGGSIDYIDKGIFVNHYYCVNKEENTVFKNVKYSCPLDNEKMEVGVKSDKVIEENGVSLTIKENTITKDGASFILSNNTDDSIIYGEYFEIEIYKNNEWHVINLEASFNDIGYTLSAHDSKELDINWKNTYVNLDSGKYRLIKKATFENQTGENYKGSFYISAEFEIK